MILVHTEAGIGDDNALSARLGVRAAPGCVAAACYARLISIHRMAEEGQLRREPVRPQLLRWAAGECASANHSHALLDIPSNDHPRYLDIGVVRRWPDGWRWELMTADPDCRPTYGPGTCRLVLDVASSSMRAVHVLDLELTLSVRDGRPSIWLSIWDNTTVAALIQNLT